MSFSSKAKTVGVGAAVVWGVWQLAQSEATAPGGTSDRTKSLTTFFDDQQKAGVEVVSDTKDNVGGLANEGLEVVNGAARQAPQAADPTTAAD